MGNDKLSMAIDGALSRLRMVDLYDRIAEAEDKVVNERAQTSIIKYLKVLVLRDSTMLGRIREANKADGRDGIVDELKNIFRERTTVSSADFDIKLFDLLHPDGNAMLEAVWVPIKQDDGLQEFELNEQVGGRFGDHV